MIKLTPHKLVLYDESKDSESYRFIGEVYCHKETVNLVLDYYKKRGVIPLEQTIDLFTHFAKQGVKIRLK